MRSKRGGKENVDDGGGMLEDEDAEKNDEYKNRDEEDEDESYEGEKRRGGEPRGQRRRREHQKKTYSLSTSFSVSKCESNLGKKGKMRINPPIEKTLRVSEKTYIFFSVQPR